MNSPLFPDVNVWVALNHGQHQHHAAALRWYAAIPDSASLVFCRQTQLGLFRILTTIAVMGAEIVTQRGCWEIFDQWASTGQVAWADETRKPGNPAAEIDRRNRFITQSVDGCLSDRICRTRGIDARHIRPCAGGES